MLKRRISEDWYFKKTGGGYARVDLPHDYQITSKRDADLRSGWDNGYFPTDTGRYVKYLNFEPNRHYVLHIDGAYMNAQVHLNEQCLATHPYGYTPFLVDLTEYTLPEITNKLLITTTPLPVSCRWYTGNGIYRDVFLYEGGRVRIEPWDAFVSTLDIGEKSAHVSLKLTVSSDITDEARIVVSFKNPRNGAVTTDEFTISVSENEKSFVERVIEIEDAALWSPDSPDLYNFAAKVYVGEELTDTSEELIGIRKIEINDKFGLLINGKPFKLRGGCIHHDHAGLGAMAYPSAEERKVRLLKEAGFNALRTAHNPPSLAFLEVCDRMGIVVMDEAFDCWNKAKTDYDYHLFFEDRAIRDIGDMVRRDRNHPSVFSYSIGNEIHEIDGTNGAALWARRLSDEVRRLDSTRPVTSGLQKDFVRREKTGEEIDPEDYKKYVSDRFMRFEVSEVDALAYPYEKELDISGDNYYFRNYETELRITDRIIWGSETRAIEFYDSWTLTKDNPRILGDFTWTAYDNLGEVGCGRYLWARDGAVCGLGPSPYPWRSCFQGDLDLTGRRRPQSYFREAVWLGTFEGRIFVTHPEHFGEGFSGTKWHWYDVSECWNYPEEYVGKPIKAEVYTTADRVVWFVNGKEVGRSAPEKGIASIDTVYRPGEISAVLYKDEKEVGRYVLSSYGAPEKIEIIPEHNTLSADGRELCFINVTVTDKDGKAIEDFDGELEIFIEGAELVCFFSGDPKNEDQYGSTICHAYRGRALAVVKTKTAGEIKIMVSSAGLECKKASVTAK